MISLKKDDTIACESTSQIDLLGTSPNYGIVANTSVTVLEDVFIATRSTKDIFLIFKNNGLVSADVKLYINAILILEFTIDAGSRADYADELVIYDSTGLLTNGSVGGGGSSSVIHTGEITGETALILDKTSVTNKSVVTPDNSDYILISDTSDSGNLKKVLFSDLSAAFNKSLVISFMKS